MEEILLKSRKDNAKHKKLWRDRHNNETEYLNMRKWQNKIHHDKVKEIAFKSAKALSREKARFKKRKGRELEKAKLKI